MGEIGSAARDMVRCLQAAGQTYWQLLPLGPTGYADSPYQALSTFAGNPMLISFEDLLEQGLLLEEDLGEVPPFPEAHVDYGWVLPFRKEVLGKACAGFSKRASEEQKQAFKTFCAKERGWLTDYALFRALKDQNDQRPWTEWDAPFRSREPETLKAFASKHRTAIRHVKLQQFFFDQQWRALRKFAHAHGVQLIGDIPIFVAHDSSDVWANPELFYLNGDGSPTVVAGVPPDYFSETGQRWGNPLYRWEVHQADGYSWWLRRMGKMADQVDIVRIDHFRGFEAYWEIPGDEDTAVNGVWKKAPGLDFFKHLLKEFGELPVIAEDLGVITKEVDLLRDTFELPGMRILQFSFGADLEPPLKPKGFPENCVVYTGTHDNDTTAGWFWREPGVNNTESEEQIEAERKRVLAEVHTDGSQIHWDLIAFCHQLTPHTAIVPLQDVMGLGTEARMNVPGQMDGNWAWRYRTQDLQAEDLQRLRDITEWSGRL